MSAYHTVISVVKHWLPSSWSCIPYIFLSEQALSALEGAVEGAVLVARLAELAKRMALHKRRSLNRSPVCIKVTSGVSADEYQSVSDLGPVVLTGQALEALEGAAEGAGLADRPAVLATRVALHERLGDVAGARRIVEAALKALRGSGDQGKGRAAGGAGAAAEGVAWLLERLARLQLQVAPPVSAEPTPAEPEPP